MVIELIFTIFLVLLNGFFVAAEFAIVKVRSSQLELKTSRNKRLGAITRHITSHLDGYLAATQLGITIASLGLGWIGEDVISKLILMLFEVLNYHPSEKLAHSIAVPIAFIFVTFMHVVFGELAPKSIAIRYPLPTTTTVAFPLRVFYVLFKPFIWVFNGFANILLRLIGIRGASHGEEVHSEEELRLLLLESSRSGSIDLNKYEIIEKVFKFDDKLVKQVMTPRTSIFALDVDTPVDEIVDTILQENYSRVPVFQENKDNIIGILYIRDLIRLLKDAKKSDIKDILHPPFFIPNTMKVGDLLLEFQQNSRHMAIITDEFGGVDGLITMEDIIEELLGEIYDEYDEKSDVSLKISDNEFIINALSPIESLNMSLPYPLPSSEHYETLSGLILFITGRIPETNEKIYHENYEFTILKKSKSKIQLVQLKIVQGVL